MTCMVSSVDLRVNVPWWIKRDPLVGNRQKQLLVDRRIWGNYKRKKKLISWWI